MTIPAEVRDQMIKELLATREGALKIGLAMITPITLRVECEAAFTRVYEFGDLGGDQEIRPSRLVDLHVPWKKATHVNLDRMRVMATHGIRDGFDEWFFDHLLRQPIVGGDPVLAAVRLTDESVAAERRKPAFYVNALTYSKCRKDGLFGHDRECQRTFLQCGHIDSFDGCPVFVSRRIPPDEMFVVSRAHTLRRGLISVDVNLLSYGPEDGKLEFLFEGSVPVSGGWPEIIRLKAQP